MKTACQYAAVMTCDSQAAAFATCVCMNATTHIKRHAPSGLTVCFFCSALNVRKLPSRRPASQAEQPFCRRIGADGQRPAERCSLPRSYLETLCVRFHLQHALHDSAPSSKLWFFNAAYALAIRVGSWAGCMAWRYLRGQDKALDHPDRAPRRGLSYRICSRGEVMSTS